MASGADVLNYLRPNGGWVIYEDRFDSILYDEGVIPVTKKEFEEGFAKVDKYFADLEATKIANKKAILERIGLTEDEAKLLLS